MNERNGGTLSPEAARRSFARARPAPPLRRAAVSADLRCTFVFSLRPGNELRGGFGGGWGCLADWLRAGGLRAMGGLVY